MWRVVLGTVLSFILWFLLGLALAAILRLAWPAYAAAEPTVSYTLPMMLARQAMAIICNITLGWGAAAIARGDTRASWALGVLLLVVMIPIHAWAWRFFPVWYHLAFLVPLVPMVGLSGHLARRRTAAVGA